MAIIPLFLAGLRGWQLVIVLLVILLLFGGKKIPELARNLGKGINSFKQGLKEVKDEIEKDVNDNEPTDTDKKD